MTVEAQPFWRLRDRGESRKLETGVRSKDTSRNACGLSLLSVESSSMLFALLLAHVADAPARYA